MRDQIKQMKDFHKEILSIQNKLENKDWALDDLTSMEDPHFEEIETIGTKLRSAFDSVWDACDSLEQLTEKMSEELTYEMAMCDLRARQGGRR